MYPGNFTLYEETSSDCPPIRSKLFEGKSITNIKPFGGLIAGQEKYYELWTQGSIITITNPRDVIAIDKAIKEAKKLNVNTESYLQYQIDVEGILN
jgi:hypothetical protein